MLSKLIAVLLILCISSTALANHPKKYNNIIVFGDSLSDIGNNHWAKAEGKVGAPMTNEEKPNNSSRPLWINKLMKLLLPKETIYSSTKISQAQLNPFYNSMSCAWASAETGMHYLNDAADSAPYPNYNDSACANQGPGLLSAQEACVPGVRRQITIYLHTVNHPDSKTLFIIWAGGNDVFNNLTKAIIAKAPLPDSLLATLAIKENKKTDPYNFSYPILNLLKAKNELIKAGVSPSQIYVINLPDLSKIPAAVELSVSNPAILTMLHATTIAFNSNLAAALTAGDTAHALPASHIFSAQNLFDRVIKNPEKFNLVNVDESCVKNNATPLCEGYLFFNEKHPTVAAGEIIAAAFKKKL